MSIDRHAKREAHDPQPIEGIGFASGRVIEDRKLGDIPDPSAEQSSKLSPKGLVSGDAGSLVSIGRHLRQHTAVGHNPNGESGVENEAYADDPAKFHGLTPFRASNPEKREDESGEQTAHEHVGPATAPAGASVV